MNQKILLNDFIFKQIKNTIHAELLQEKIREQHVSMDRLAEDTNNFQLEICPEKLQTAIQNKFSFKKRFEAATKRVNLIKQFTMTDALWCFDSGQMENITRHLKIWKINQWGQMAGNPDTGQVFPFNEMQLYQMALDKGYIEQDREPRNKTIFYLTKKGANLPKVKRLLAEYPVNSMLNDRRNFRYTNNNSYETEVRI